MPKKILIVAETTEKRVGKRTQLIRMWGKDHIIRSAAHAHAIGVSKEISPDIVIICMVSGSALVYEEIERVCSGA